MTPAAVSEQRGGDVILELRKIWRSFGNVKAVRGVDLSVFQGEFFTLLGPSGSGKTTMLRLLAGFERPDSGEIYLNGKNISPLPPNLRGIGLVFQNYALFPHMTIAKNVAYGLRMRRWTKAEISRRVAEVLDLVHLTGVEQRRPQQLSGGQQQRVALARALAFKPALLLMDEPLGALDRALRTEMQQEMRRIHREAQTTVLYVTHDQEEALSMSTRIGVLREGRLVQIGPAQDVFERPTDTFVASFFGECNLWPVRGTYPLDQQRIKVRVGEWELAICKAAPDSSAEGMVLLRPSRLRLKEEPGDLVVEGRVWDVQYLGEVRRVTVEHPEFGTIIATVDRRVGAELRPGIRIRLAFAPTDLLFVPSA